MKPIPYSLSPEQVATLEQLAPRVKQWARRLGTRHRDKDELDSVALTAAATAIQQYDPTRGMTLRTFVLYTVRMRLYRVQNPKRNRSSIRRRMQRAPEGFLATVVDTRPTVSEVEIAEQDRADRLRYAADLVREGLRSVDPLVSRVFEQRLTGAYNRDMKNAAAALGVSVSQYRSASTHLHQIIRRVADNHAKS